jgi:hypothetical protein
LNQVGLPGPTASIEAGSGTPLSLARWIGSRGSAMLRFLIALWVIAGVGLVGLSVASWLYERWSRDR